LNNSANLYVKNAQNSHTPILRKTGVPSLNIKYYEFNMVEHFYVVFVSEMKILRIILLFECQKRAKQLPPRFAQNRCVIIAYQILGIPQG